MPVNIDRDFEAFCLGMEEVGPTVRDFQTALGFSSTSVAHYHLRALVDAGLIERRTDLSHTVRGYDKPYRLTAKGYALRERLRAGLSA